MIIKTIEFENFRNFKGRNVIHCSTDGKVTIVYGNNGDGKTTLHQLFQWAFYNTVHFNKTASDKMYNLQLEREQPYGQAFQVWATIAFSHDGSEYLLRREWTYKKGLDDSKKIGEDFSISKQDDDFNWNRLSNPEIIIEQLLPSGLSEYFFFDGESMIADLRVKGHESANKLKKALFSILDLNLLENAIAHIGSIELKTTVLGKLFLSKAGNDTSEDVARHRSKVESCSEQLDRLDLQLQAKKDDRKKKQQFISEASEKIGGTKSKQEYEKERNRHKSLREGYLEQIKKTFAAFGRELIATYPHMLMAYTVQKRGRTIRLPESHKKHVPGVSKTLVQALLKSSKCICGQELTEEHYAELRSFLEILPPSYDAQYTHFLRAADARMTRYDPTVLREQIIDILSYREKAEKEDQEIAKLDEQAKSVDMVLQALMDDRRKAEIAVSQLNTDISALEGEVTKYKAFLHKFTKEFTAATANLQSNELAETRITLVEQVKAILQEQLNTAAVAYSQKLQVEIQLLLDHMLTSKRQVVVSSDFSMRVFDSYNDESKSEGQFAVVSFAYIGGILKLLKSEPQLRSKEYPLVLDGPFSKLGLDHRSNVIKTIPEYAPQIIIFSKDNLQGDIPEEKRGYVWTIQSNEEKNVACVKEGFLW